MTDLWTTYKLLVLRPTEPDVQTVFSCTADSGLEPDEIFQRVLTAVNKWFRLTPEGQQALRETNGDYNVGDLTSDMDEVEPFLTAEGLKNCSLERLEVTRCDWRYDTLLYKEADE